MCIHTHKTISHVNTFVASRDDAFSSSECQWAVLRLRSDSQMTLQLVASAVEPHTSGGIALRKWKVQNCYFGIFWVCSNMYKYVGYLNMIKHGGFTGRKWWVHFPTKRPGRGALIPTFSALPEAMNSANSCDHLQRCGGVPMNRTMKRRNMLYCNPIKM